MTTVQNSQIQRKVFEGTINKILKSYLYEKKFKSVVIILRLTHRSCLKPCLYRRILTSLGKNVTNMATAADATSSPDEKVALITKNLKVSWCIYCVLSLHLDLAHEESCRNEIIVI